jgi:hypothetical protein
VRVDDWLRKKKGREASCGHGVVNERQTSLYFTYTIRELLHTEYCKNSAQYDFLDFWKRFFPHRFSGLVD